MKRGNDVRKWATFQNKNLVIYVTCPRSSLQSRRETSWFQCKTGFFLSLCVCVSVCVCLCVCVLGMCVFSYVGPVQSYLKNKEFRLERGEVDGGGKGGVWVSLVPQKGRQFIIMATESSWAASFKSRPSPFVGSSNNLRLSGRAAPPLVNQRADGCSGCCRTAGETINMMSERSLNVFLCVFVYSTPPAPDPPSAPPLSRPCHGAIGSPCTAPPGPSCSRGRGRCAAATGGLQRSWTAAGPTGRCSGGESGCRPGRPCRRWTPPSDSPHGTCKSDFFLCLFLSTVWEGEAGKV